MQDNQPGKKPDLVTESIDYIFKMRRDGRMDEEEAQLAIGAIFSGEISEKELEMFRFMYLFRKKEGSRSEIFGDEDPKDPRSDDKGVTIMIQIK